MLDQYAELAKEEMELSVEALKEALAVLRTGRASASVLNGLQVEYYGDLMPVNQIASVKVPEPRQLLIIPYDRNDIKSIVAAINKSDIGINPIVDANQIRLVFPALTEERRRELSKKAKTMSDEYKVTIRNIRRDAMDQLKKDESYTEDTKKRAEEDIQKVTDEYIAKIEEVFKEKEKEIMNILDESRWTNNKYFKRWC